MTAARNPRALVLRWLRLAEEDLEASEILAELEEAPAGSICTLTRESAEKAIKAVLVEVQADIPDTRDLNQLAGLLPKAWSLDLDDPELGRLTDWAVRARFPGNWEDPSEEDAAQALNIATMVWDAVCSRFEEHGIKLV